MSWPHGRKDPFFVPPNQAGYHSMSTRGPSRTGSSRIFPPQPLMNYTAPDPKKYIPFVDEDPWIRKKFEEKELAKNGLTSLMPAGPTRTRTLCGTRIG